MSSRELKHLDLRIYVDYRDRFRILVYVFQSCLHQWKSVQLEIMRPRRCMQC